MTVPTAAFPPSLSGGPFRSDPQPLSPPLSCDLGCVPVRPEGPREMAVRSARPAPLLPPPLRSPQHRLPEPGAPSEFSAALTGAPSELSAPSRPATQGPVWLFGAALGAEQSSHRAPRAPSFGPDSWAPRLLCQPLSSSSLP